MVQIAQKKSNPDRNSTADLDTDFATMARFFSQLKLSQGRLPAEGWFLERGSLGGSGSEARGSLRVKVRDEQGNVRASVWALGLVAVAVGQAKGTTSYSPRPLVGLRGCNSLCNLFVTISVTLPYLPLYLIYLLSSLLWKRGLLRGKTDGEAMQ